ncbi:MAG: asparagine synthetase A [Candidatus Marsarchaeota archaeon]|jgi:asparaginyl-tRNA synthetase|nr:asparagine synthetase A [Candidatus Marsarchaeota archaeon]MCL5418357.1 asparagine synthetase A [Candidatus Marsarchaeota archaeon]
MGYAMKTELVETGLPKPVHRLSEEELAEKRAMTEIGAEVVAYMESYMRRKGFVQLMPVLLSPITDPLWPDPAAGIYKRLEFEIYGKTVRTMHSMIVHKLVAVSLLHKKIFIVSPNIRLEKPERSKTGRHLFEFSQLDFEARGATSKQIRKLIEGMLAGLVKHIGSSKKAELSSLHASLPKFSTPFKVLSREELEARYGTDWEEELPKHIDEPVWITDLPREFYDFEDPVTHKWDNFDLYLPKRGELVTGAKREYEHSKMLAKMRKAGVKEELYATLLDLAKDGKIKQSAGAGIGVERLIAWITSARHIGEVQPFPKIPGAVYEL